MTWWVWLIAAVVLLVGELLTEGFFLFWFAAGAIASTVAALFTNSLPIQLAVFILITAILLFYSRQLGEKISKGKPDTNTNADVLIGATGIVIREVLPHQKGLVKVKGEEWSCVADDGALIPEGTLVQIVDLQGVTLTVAPAEKRKAG